MMKQIRVLAVLAVCVLGLGSSALLYGQNDAITGASYLTTITVAGTGAFSSRSTILFHADHSLTVVDSGQGGPGIQFSSQQGAWRDTGHDNIAARTLDFSFPGAGIARVDYLVTTISANGIAGTITLTFFGLTDNPLDGGGIPGGTFNFTGTKITVP